MNVSPVPQRGVGQNNDCGPACVAMLAGVINPALATQETMIALATRFDGPDDGTTPQDLVRMAQSLGIELVYRATVIYPYITLVDYNTLPAAFRSQASMRIAHWIVRLSDTEYLDPYWWTTAQVGPHTTIKGVLDAAEKNARKWASLPLPCRVGFARPPEPVPVIEVNMKRISKGVNLRTRAIELTAELAPKSKTEGDLTRIGWLSAGTEVDVLRHVGAWAEIAVALDGGRKIGQGYAYASLLAEPTPPPAVVVPPVPAQRPRVGVSILDQHHIANALDGLDVLIMNGIQECRNYKQRWPSANVLCRRFLEHGNALTDPYSPAMRELHTVGGGVIVVSPHNECDHGHCYHTESDIAKRADFDMKMATECRKHGTFYAGMSVSMGVPDYTRPDVCEWIKKYYAPHYNSGLMGINYHSYSPNPDHIFASDGRQIWYETRWRFLFDRCGFINDGTNPVGIVCDESGLDEGGVGGVPAHGLGGDYVERWTRRAIQIQSEPVQGRASPLRTMTWYQAGRKDWAGFDIAPFIGEIRRGNA